MKNLIRLLILCGFLTYTGSASAIVITLNAQAPTVEVGDFVSLDLNVSDLGVPPSVGGYFTDISYDPSMFSMNSVSFGPELGNPVLGEAYLNAGTYPGLVILEAISFLGPYELDLLQPPSFTLATLEFTAMNVGPGHFGMGYIEILNGFGEPQFYFDQPFAMVNVVPPSNIPEPSTLLLLSLGLVGLVGLSRKKSN